MQSSEREAKSFRWPEWKPARDARVEKVATSWAVASLHTLTECSGADAIGSRATVIRWWSSDWVTGDGAECSVWRLNCTVHCEHEWRTDVRLLTPAKNVCENLYFKGGSSSSPKTHFYSVSSTLCAFFCLRRPWLMGWRVFIAMNSISATVNKEWHFSFISTWKSRSGKREAEKKPSWQKAAR